MLRELNTRELVFVSGGTTGEFEEEDTRSWKEVGDFNGDGDIHDEAAIGLGVIGGVAGIFAGVAIAAAAAPLVIIGITAVAAVGVIGSGVAAITDPSRKPPHSTGAGGNIP